MRLPILHILVTLIFCDYNHLSGCEVVLHYGFDLYFLALNNIEHFYVLNDYLYVFIRHASFQPLFLWILFSIPFTFFFYSATPITCMLVSYITLKICLFLKFFFSWLFRLHNLYGFFFKFTGNFFCNLKSTVVPLIYGNFQFQNFHMILFLIISISLLIFFIWRDIIIMPSFIYLSTFSFIFWTCL